MLTIAWDVDDVLNHLMRSWFEAWRGDRPACAVRYEDLRQNPPEALLGISRVAYLRSLDRFRLERFATLAPDPAVLSWFHRHGHRFRHLAITATPLVSAPASAAWVMRHFGSWIRSFNVVPSPRDDEDFPAHEASQGPTSKGEMLAQLGRIDVLVDDDPHNLAGAQAVGILGVLMPRPWNAGWSAQRGPAGALAQILSLTGTAPDSGPVVERTIP